MSAPQPSSIRDSANELEVQRSVKSSTIAASRPSPRPRFRDQMLGHPRQIRGTYHLCAALLR
ncbi:hypothetical protein PILCRDRAFT_185877 [Piloderma croceum F 1598]|uniref:Uncharacterized protein n=1 Tax=Piloderma croceum (strain F 1598) TaxID=765440 RepID=A0A0C3GFQ8_PILCF|nr:hypothetical protein PILCRDRAFT_185877 [Piloderma croceum F 1598]